MLHLHRSERAEPLVTALGRLLAQPCGDPFATEVVAVPSRGVERWLAQQLSHVLGAGPAGDGVCANVAFPAHLRVLDDAVAAADPAFAASAELWSAERSLWPLLAVIERCVPTEPWCSVLAAHLGLTVPGAGNERAFGVARRLAAHFAAYGRARPAILRAWVAGVDEQGDGTAVDADLAWQAELWRRLRAEIGVPSPAELLDVACAHLRASPDLVSLPDRVSVFGPTRLSPARIAVLAALAEHRDLHLWLNHPSPALWDRLAAEPAGPPRRRRAGQPLLGNPLLAALSRDLRELQAVLRAAAPNVDHHHDAGPRPPTLLGRIQTELATDAVATPSAIAPGDRSLQVHACHGAARQVEVVREVILGLLADDPSLEPRDVLVMCPDVETFAPLVAAAFGMTDEHDGHPAARLRVRLADRSPQRTNPMLALTAQLLTLAAGRVTATEVLDLAGTPPVRRRFGFDDDDVETLRAWTASSNARWGLDAGHRDRFGLGRLAQGTWRNALDRLLLGVAMEQGQRWLGGTLPLDEVDSADIDLAGRFAELLDRIDTAVRAFEGRRTVSAWVQLLSDLVLGLGEPDEGWQSAELRRELDDLAEAAVGAVAEIGLAEVGALLRARLRARPTRASFRTGTLTVCTLVPMRSVPHRVVCMIGMDDGAFPRKGVLDGDDLLLRSPAAGERDVRSEDRQLFLDAVCAAGEYLIITYTGADPRSGVEVPPCVPLGELLDAVAAGAVAAGAVAAGAVTTGPVAAGAVDAGPDGLRARHPVVVRHPLQPFDARNFSAAALVADRVFSFDPSGLAGARAAAGPRSERPPLIGSVLDPPPATESIDLDDLVRFLQHPARAFLRQRLGITTSARAEDPDDTLPVELDGLEGWAVGDRVLRQCLAGIDTRTAATVEYLRGELPPGPLGQATMRRIGPKVEALLAACADERARPAAALDVDVVLPDGRHLTGTVTGVRAGVGIAQGGSDGPVALSVTYSRLAAKHRLAAWVRHLALAAGDGADGSLSSVVVGARTGGVRRSVITGVDRDVARRVLTELVELRDAGLREALPMPVQSCAVYAERRVPGAPVEQCVEQARGPWEQDTFAPENAEPEHLLVFGEGWSFQRLLQEQPNAVEQGWGFAERSRFATLALRLWTPLLAASLEQRR